MNDPLESLLHAYGNLAGIVGIGLFGVILLLTIWIARRRYWTRQREAEERRLHHEKSEDPQDLWQTGGRRLASRVTPAPPDFGERPEEPEIEDDDEEDEDEWWKRGGEA